MALILRRNLKPKAKPAAPASWYEGWNVGSGGRRPKSPYVMGTLDDAQYWTGYYAGVGDRNERCGYTNESPVTRTRLYFKDVHIGERLATADGMEFVWEKIGPQSARAYSEEMGHATCYFDPEEAAWIPGPMFETV